MRFNEHSRLAGQHAFLAASSPSWLNYDDHKMSGKVISSVAARRGTALHQLAQDLINLQVKLPETQQTLNMYVNDCLGFRMTPEQVLYYSDNCFGTTDAIDFRQGKLKIFDLKNGLVTAGFNQLIIYAALFCLEYRYKPTEIEIELRIYQNDDVKILIADPLDVISVMDKIVHFDSLIDSVKEEVL